MILITAVLAIIALGGGLIALGAVINSLSAREETEDYS